MECPLSRPKQPPTEGAPMSAFDPHRTWGPAYSINSSARATIDGGMVRRSALAVCYSHSIQAPQPEGPPGPGAGPRADGGPLHHVRSLDRPATTSLPPDPPAPGCRPYVPVRAAWARSGRLRRHDRPAGRPRRHAPLWGWLNRRDSGQPLPTPRWPGPSRARRPAVPRRHRLQLRARPAPVDEARLGVGPQRRRRRLAPRPRRHRHSRRGDDP